MDPNLDLAKIVGAASAPVALIIANCIYLGNMSAKSNILFQKARDLLQELRDDPAEQRAKSIHKQVHLYERRIAATMLCTLLLNASILCFVLTVICTGVAVLLPDNAPVKAATMLVMTGGVLVFASSVVVETWSNRLIKPTLESELALGNPGYRPVLTEAR